MRILVVSQYYYPEPLRINEICEALVARGHEVTVVTCNPNYPDGEIYKGYVKMKLSQSVTCSVSELPTHRGRYASDASAVGRLGLLHKATAPQMYNPVLLRLMVFYGLQ